MAELRSFCGNCCFYEKDSKSCMHGLIPEFQDRGADIEWLDDGPAIDRICLYARDDDWMENKTKEEKIEQCNEEVYISGTIILIANNENDLVKSIQKLNKQKNIERFKIIILYTNITYSNMLKVCNDNIKAAYYCVKMTVKEIKYQILKALKHAKNGYLITIECDKDIDGNLLDKINNIVNKKMFRVIHVEGLKEYHQSVSMLHIYKWLKGDLPCSIKEKLVDIASQEDTDPHIFTWKELNEQYSN